MAYYSQWTATPLGTEDASSKRDKSGNGLLGSLKDFFKVKSTPRSGKKSRKGIVSKSDSDVDITDNYNNFHRGGGMRSSFGVSPYDALSPNSFFTNQGGVMKTTDVFKPKQFGAQGLKKPKEPPIQEFEIPVASGPARRSVVGLFDNKPNQTSEVTQTVAEATPPADDWSRQTTEHRSSTDTPKGSRGGESSRTSPSLRGLNVPAVIVSQPNEDEKGSNKNKLSSQCSDLSVKSEDPRLLYQQIQERESSRAVARRGSLPTSISKEDCFC